MNASEIDTLKTHRETGVFLLFPLENDIWAEFWLLKVGKNLLFVVGEAEATDWTWAFPSEAYN